MSRNFFMESKDGWAYAFCSFFWTLETQNRGNQTAQSMTVTVLTCFVVQIVGSKTSFAFLLSSLSLSGILIALEDSCFLHSRLHLCLLTRCDVSVTVAVKSSSGDCSISIPIVSFHSRRDLPAPWCGEWSLMESWVFLVLRSKNLGLVCLI